MANKKKRKKIPSIATVVKIRCRCCCTCRSFGAKSDPDELADESKSSDTEQLHDTGNQVLGDGQAQHTDYTGKSFFFPFYIFLSAIDRIVICL